MNEDTEATFRECIQNARTVKEGFRHEKSVMDEVFGGRLLMNYQDLLSKAAAEAGTMESQLRDMLQDYTENQTNN